jgi:predicted nuclease of restriction endonuclease-like (RecB) superfamily
MSDRPLPIPPGYNEFLRQLKDRIRRSQVQAALAVNQTLVQLYWQIGQDILSKEQEQGWGAKVVDRLSIDLKREFPEMKGFSPRNLRYMKAFADAYPTESILQQAAAKIPWFHNCLLLDRVKNLQERLWYIEQTIACGWSRSLLTQQIDSQLYARQGVATTNFLQTLPSPQSDLAQQVLRDPYNFDFLSLGAQALERDIEAGLVTHIRDFLLALGVGFSFIGSQYPLQVSGREFRLDLLFYHFRLHCFVVIDLKTGEFEPAFSGQMNFYVSAVDDLLRGEVDHPTIGIILCKSQDKTIVEYSLRDMNKPIGVSTYQLRDALPEQLQSSLPTIEQLEVELEIASQEIASEEI